MRLPEPPHNAELEAEVIGSTLFDRSLLDDGLAELDAEVFYVPRHQTVWRAVLALYGRGEPIDLPNLSEELRQRGKLPEVGGPPALMGLADLVSHSGYGLPNARKLEGLHKLRLTISTAQQAIRQAYEPDADAGTVFEDLERSLTGIISRGRDGRGWNDYQTEAIAMLEQGGGLPTGYASLDRFVGGIPRKGMTILAGRPAMGKTSLLRGIIRRQVQQGHKILWFSVDQPGGDITLLEASRLAKLSADRVRGQQLSTVERHRLRESIGRFVASYREQVELHDSSLSLPKIVSGIRAAARRGLSMVAIDYIQRVNVPGIASGDNYGRVTEVARTLDDVSMELGLPVVALAQLSKEIEKRGNKRPMLGDLRESGYLEQDAKTVLGIYRDDYYAKQEDRPSQHEGVAEVLILKNKLGPTGKVDLKWHDAYADFEELAASWQEQQAVRFL